MIRFYDNRGPVGEAPAGSMECTVPAGTIWLDLVSADDREIVMVEAAVGLKMPSAHRLAEVETSSRLAINGSALQVASPILFRDETGELRTTPVGFVLTNKLLITIRFETIKAYEDFAATEIEPDDNPFESHATVFLGLLNAAVDRMADGMEHMGAELDQVSRQIFGHGKLDGAQRRANQIEAGMRETLKIVGRNGDMTSHVRDSLLGLGRMVSYVGLNAGDRLPGESKPRLKSLRQDIASLNDYETRLTDKVQFLLDSTLGFINIEQNRTFKLLTIASVIGIPPTFVVGLYGMNFKNMPEYDWAWGYEWGLLLVALSIVIPIIWLRWRGLF